MFKDIAKRIEALFITRSRLPERPPAALEPKATPEPRAAVHPPSETTRPATHRFDAPKPETSAPDAPVRIEAPAPEPNTPSSSAHSEAPPVEPARSPTPRPAVVPKAKLEAPRPSAPPRAPDLEETEEAPVVAVRRTRPPKLPRQRQRTPQRKRLYHLGVDWGTSATKMVLRDYGAKDDAHDHGHAYVIRHHNRDYRYPSSVRYWRGGLWFGHQAESRRREGLGWTSLKARAAVQGGWEDRVVELPGMTLEDLATLSVAHCVRCGFEEAERQARSKRATLRMGMTLSVPVAELEIPSTQRAYLRVAALAYHLAVRQGFDPQGKSPGEALLALSEAKDAVLLNIDEVPPTAFLRAEVAAAMMWPFSSPSVKEGPYTVVDIGAATTNASWFRIHSGRDEADRHVPKSSMTFFGAETLPPGMDAFDEALAELLGRDDPTNLRGVETEWVAKVRSREALDKVVGEYWETWHKAKLYAWKMAPRERHWEGTRVLLVGGGSKVPLVDKAFDKLPSHTQAKIIGASRLHDPGVPSDLYELPRSGGFAHPFREEATFLLVAYGLSFNDEDRPEINLPGQVGRFQGKRERRYQPSSLELGYDEK